MNTILLTSTQAAKVASLKNGEKCELTLPSDWQPPKDGVVCRARNDNWCIKSDRGLNTKVEMYKILTPKYTLNTIYGVLEPFWYEVAIGEPTTPSDNHMFYAANSMDINNRTVPWFPARDLPDNLIRSHIIIHKLTPKIEDGVLVWVAVVERTENK